MRRTRLTMVVSSLVSTAINGVRERMMTARSFSGAADTGVPNKTGLDEGTFMSRGAKVRQCGAGSRKNSERLGRLIGNAGVEMHGNACFNPRMDAFLQAAIEEARKGLAAGGIP